MIIAGYGAGPQPGLLLTTGTLAFAYDVHNETRTHFPPLPGDDSSILNVVTKGGEIVGFSFNVNTQSVVLFDHRGNGTGKILRTEPNGYGYLQANDQFIVETYSGTAPRSSTGRANGSISPRRSKTPATSPSKTPGR